MTPHPPPPRRDAGHTLIELSIVLLLIGIAVSLAAPAMGRYMARTRVERAIERVASDLAFTRIAAIRNGQPVELVFESGSQYSIRVPSTAATLRTVSLAEDMPGVAVTAPTADSRLEFDARGVLRSIGTGTLRATDGSVTESATLTLAGRVYRED
jgi:prepilin-type N-terminal cleavage/methylation domain-containing protein